MNGESISAAKSVINAPTGSTAPESAPNAKAFLREAPSAFSGSETTAPSGKFWIAIPMARAKAAESVMATFPESQPAKTMPTAMPSGKLWSVTASVSIVVRFNFARGPSGVLLPKCKCGVILSKMNKNKIPAQNPIAAGANASLPMCSLALIAGRRRLQTDAATITPAAKASNPRLRFCFICPRTKNTQAAPRTVPKNGMVRPWTICKTGWFMF